MNCTLFQQQLSSSECAGRTDGSPNSLLQIHFPCACVKPYAMLWRWLLPDSASHHPRSIWSAPSFLPSTSSPLSQSISQSPTWSASPLKNLHFGSEESFVHTTLLTSDVTFLLVSLCVFIIIECVCVSSISGPLRRRIIRPEITQRARRNVFKNIQTTKREVSPHLH